MSAGCFHQFGETVQMTSCAVVMDGDNRVVVRFGNRTDHVGNAFLHFRVGTLYGVQLDTACILSRVYGRYGSTTHTDTVVIATDHNHFFARFRIALQGITHICETYTAGKHDYFVVSVLLIVLRVLESQ